MENRICTVYKEKRKRRFIEPDKIDDGLGIFRGFGTAYETFENTSVCFTIAIVERDDGSLESVPLHLIKLHAESETLAHAKKTQ